MYTWLNISHFHDEHDFFLKFVEKKEAISKSGNLKKNFTAYMKNKMAIRNHNKQIINGASNVLILDNSSRLLAFLANLTPRLL